MELNMKKKLLCCALLAGVGMANTAAAQSYDDRWYVGAGVGVGFFDQDRDVQDDIYGVIALGKMITPNISIEA
jgi:OOP family OmpA-OmpF porin